MLIAVITFVVFIFYKYRSAPAKSIINYIEQRIYAIADNIGMPKLEGISDEEVYTIVNDINKDGYNDLIWQEKEARISNGKRIVGIFSCVPEKSRCIIWDTGQMKTA